MFSQVEYNRSCRRDGLMTRRLSSGCALNLVILTLVCLGVEREENSARVCERESETERDSETERERVLFIMDLISQCFGHRMYLVPRSCHMEKGNPKPSCTSSIVGSSSLPKALLSLRLWQEEHEVGAARIVLFFSRETMHLCTKSSHSEHGPPLARALFIRGPHFPSVWCIEDILFLGNCRKPPKTIMQIFECGPLKSSKGSFVTPPLTGRAISWRHTGGFVFFSSEIMHSCTKSPVSQRGASSKVPKSPLCTSQKPETGPFAHYFDFLTVPQMVENTT